MHRLSGCLILMFVFFPLAIAAMTLTAIRPWVLDRGFYERLLSDEPVYVAMHHSNLANPFSRTVLVGENQLPLSALNTALHEVITPDDLRRQSLSVIDEVFDFIEGSSPTPEISLDTTALKTVMAGEGSERFARALAGALPVCEVDQAAIAPGGSLVRCIASGSSVDAAAMAIAGALPAVLEDVPDRIVLNTPVQMPDGGYFTGWMTGIPVRMALDLGMMTLILTAAGMGIIGAYVGGADRRGRLVWLSAALLVPASLFVLMGLVLRTPLIAMPLSDALNTVTWFGIEYNVAMGEAISAMSLLVVQQISGGCLMTGMVSGVIALGLLVWSWQIPTVEHRHDSRISTMPEGKKIAGRGW